jgi:NADH-quinone oxidoreductase subunit M
MSYLIGLYSIYNFNDLKLVKLTSFEYFFLYLIIFLGFGFKIPIWPFHYWLTKTHVEAPSGFSIYLSGFLVKSALYGFYKINSCIAGSLNSSLFLMICIFGVIDSSLKMWGQTDIKKLVAYGTVQEMNLIFLVFCWGDLNCINIGIIFSATHAFLSALMFYLVDCLYRRYHTRSLVEINGILHFTPNLALVIIFMTVFFAGLPGTLKYIVEFYIFSGFLEISPSSTFLLMLIANAFGLIGFSKCWYNLIFGGRKDVFHSMPLDLTYKEIYIFTFCFYFLFSFSFFAFFFY